MSGKSTPLDLSRLLCRLSLLADGEKSTNTRPAMESILLEETKKQRGSTFLGLWLTVEKGSFYLQIPKGSGGISPESNGVETQPFSVFAVAQGVVTQSYAVECNALFVGKKLHLQVVESSGGGNRSGRG
jgi:hypothetical protein